MSHGPPGDARSSRTRQTKTALILFRGLWHTTCSAVMPSRSRVAHREGVLPTLGLVGLASLLAGLGLTLRRHRSTHQRFANRRRASVGMESRGPRDVHDSIIERKENEMTTTLMAGVLAGTALICAAHPAVAQDKGKTEAAELTSKSQAALKQLYATVPLAKELGPKALAILVFSEVTKAGLGVGGQYGEGALLKGGSAVAFYKTTGASFGLQAGAQQYGYAMFFMNAKALEQLDNAKGFEVGVGPSVVLVTRVWRRPPPPRR